MTNKILKDLLSKANNKGEKRFIAKHKINQNKSNVDMSIFDVDEVKPVNREKERHGYSDKKSKAVYEDYPTFSEFIEQLNNE